MNALLLVAHGSRRQPSNDEVRALADQVASGTGEHFEIVKCAFLELAEPSIPNGIKQCAGEGASNIVILPYFLSAGRHVAEDIPGEVDSMREIYPNVGIHIAPYLGSIDSIADILATQAHNALINSSAEYGAEK